MSAKRKEKLWLAGKVLAFALVVAGLFSILPRPTTAQTTPSQCISAALAGGTGDIITLPSIPCWPTSTLLILHLTAANTTTAPTISVSGSAPVKIVNYDGSSPGVGELGAGQVRLLTYNGANWTILTNNSAISGLPSVNSTAAIEGEPTSFAPLVVKTGYFSNYDMPPAYYYSSTNSCSVLDNGSCFAASGGGSWNLLPQTLYDIRWWGLGSNPIQFFAQTSGSDANNFCVVSSLPCASRARVFAMNYRFCALNGNDLDNFGPGIFTDVSWISGPLPCAGNTNGSLQGSIYISGANTTPTSTTTQFAGGASACGNIIPGAGVSVWLENLYITGTGNSCQSSVYPQLGGWVNIGNNVNWGPASVDQVHLEDSSSTAQWWTSANGDAVTGVSPTAQTFLECSEGNCKFSGQGVTTFYGTPHYANALIAVSFSTVTIFGNPPLVGAVNAPSFRAYGNGRLLNETETPSVSLLPGTFGIEYAGGREYPETPSSVQNAEGFGTGSSETVSGGSHGGMIKIVTGSATAPTSSIQLNFGTLLENPFNGSVAPCTFAPDQSDTAWGPGTLILASTAYPNAPARLIDITATLSDNTTYDLDYTCQGD